MSAFIQGKGDVFGPLAATDGDLAIFDGPSGKIIKGTPTLSNKSFETAGYVFRPSGVLVCNAALVVAPLAGAGADVFSISIPAGMLARDGDTLRITFYTYTSTNTGSKMARLFFGGVNVYLVDNASTTSVEYMHTVFLTRMNANQQRLTAMRSTNTNNTNAENSSPTANLAIANQLTLNLWANVANAVQSRMGMVEFLPVP